jgi:predicted DNA-binding transcriptional regulator YafY
MLLCGGRTQTADALAEEFGVNVRTIYRDIRKLQGAGFSIAAATGPGGGYSLGSNAELDPLLYGDDATLAGLLTGGSHARLGAQREAVDKVLRRAEELLAKEDREVLNRVRSRIQIDTTEWYWNDKPEQDLRIFKEAALNDRVLTITFTERDQPTIFADTVHPYGLVWKGGFWYLVAYSTREETFRRYRIQRVMNAEVSGESFQRKRDFDVADFWRKDLESFGLGRTHVVLRIDAVAIPEFVHFRWKSQNTITKSTDHWLVEMRVNRTEWLVPLILSYGGRVSALKPEALRSRVADEARELVRAHSTKAPSPPAKGRRTEEGDIRSRAVRGRG